MFGYPCSNQPYQFALSTNEKAKKRRGKRTAGLRAKRDERVAESIAFLAERGQRACVHDDERHETIRTSHPDSLLPSLIELERVYTSRASASPESLATLTASTDVSDALHDYATCPWMFDPANHPKVFVRVYEGDNDDLSEAIQQYYFRTFRYSAAALLEHIATYCKEFQADAHRFAVLVRCLANLEKLHQICLNYVGTTYASSPAGRHSSDTAAVKAIYSRLANWMKLFPADEVEVWKMYALDQRLDGPADWSPMQLHRQNEVAMALEEALIDLGGDYLLNSAFGGTTSFKFSPMRMSPEERATESLVRLVILAWFHLSLLTPLTS